MINRDLIGKHLLRRFGSEFQVGQRAPRIVAACQVVRDGRCRVGRPVKQRLSNAFMEKFTQVGRDMLIHCRANPALLPR